MSSFVILQRSLEDYLDNRTHLTREEADELLEKLRENVYSKLNPALVEIVKVIDDPPKFRGLRDFDLANLEAQIISYEHEASQQWEQRCKAVEALAAILTSSKCEIYEHFKLLTKFFFKYKPENKKKPLIRLLQERDREKGVIDFLGNFKHQLLSDKNDFKAGLGGFDNANLISKVFCGPLRPFKKLNGEELNDLAEFFTLHIAPILRMEREIDEIDANLITLRKEFTKRTAMKREKSKADEYLFYKNRLYLSDAQKALLHENQGLVDDVIAKLKITRDIESRLKADASKQSEYPELEYSWADDAELKRLDWKLLEEYCLNDSLEELMKALRSYLENIHGEKLDWQRVEKINQLRPNAIYIGNKNLRGYICFLFKDKHTAVLEKPLYGNATYLLPEDNWKELSKLTRRTLLTEYPEVKRCIHYDFDSWIANVQRSLEMDVAGDTCVLKTFEPNT